MVSLYCRLTMVKPSKMRGEDGENEIAGGKGTFHSNPRVSPSEQAGRRGWEAGVGRCGDVSPEQRVSARETVVPFIRMSGVWLQQLGFDRGDRIEVTAERERLVLTVVRDE